MKLKFRARNTPKELRDIAVQNIKTRLQEAKSVVLFSSQFVTHQDFETLRKELVKTQAKLEFVKNTLFRVACKELSLPETLYTDEIMFGPSGAVFITTDDFVGAIKVLKAQFGKNENVKVKVGLLDSEVYEASKVLEFANIPSIEQLHAKLVGSLVGPLYGLHYALSSDMNKLVRGLSEVAKVVASSK